MSKENDLSRKEVFKQRYEELEEKREEIGEDKYFEEAEKIDVDDLVEEFIPLLKDFFVGDFINLQNMILCTFYNGDKFRITVEKVEDEDDV